MTTEEFFSGFRNFLIEDKITEPYKDTFHENIFEQKFFNNKGKLFTRTGYRVALIFFEQYGKANPEFGNPECFRAYASWGNRDIEKIKERLSKEYDTVMYVGKENCDEKCNIAIFDPNVVTMVELLGGVEAFLDSLED